MKFFYFQVHFPCKWEVFFELNKETMFSICIGLHHDELSARNKWVIAQVFEEYLWWILPSLLFPAYGFKTIPEALKIIVLPAPFNNPHQLLLVEKLTDYPQVIGRKLR